MKRIVVLLMLTFSFNIMYAQNQDPWTDYMTPSDIHTMLTHYTGSFNMEIRMSIGEGKESPIITVSSEHTMLLGGRFLEMKQKGNMMGMDYQSIITVGFNNSNKQMSMTTITNMGTGTLSLIGPWDEKSKSANLIGEILNPVSKNTISVRQVISFVDINTILIESYDKEGDEPAKKTVEYKLVRNL